MSSESSNLDYTENTVHKKYNSKSRIELISKCINLQVLVRKVQVLCVKTTPTLDLLTNTIGAIVKTLCPPPAPSTPVNLFS